MKVDVDKLEASLLEEALQYFKDHREGNEYVRSFNTNAEMSTRLYDAARAHLDTLKKMENI